MGCDIHAIVEYRHARDTGEMHSLSWDEFWLPRHYGVFAALAGVRGEGPPPKGRPDNETEWLSENSMADRDSGHSHSWATVDEWESALTNAGVEDPEYWAILAAAKSLEQHNVQGVRITYWFDN